MTRTEMEPTARERLLEAMLRELGEKGQEGIVVAEVLSQVGVTGEEFAAEYADLDACLVEAYAAATAHLVEVVRAGCRGEGGVAATWRWPRRVAGGLEALLAELAGDPQMAHTVIRAFPSRGTHSQVRYQEVVESFAPMLAAGRQQHDTEVDLPEAVEMLAVGAAEAIIYDEVAAGRTAGLADLGPSILFSILVPFLGPVAAASEMEAAHQRRQANGSV